MLRFFDFLISNKRIKGSISLFLVVVLTPFLSIALVFEELGRYQQTLQALEEINSSASLSVLADYDPYLSERFALEAIKQGEDVDSVFKEYVDYNSKWNDSLLEIVSTKAEGENALGSADSIRILEAQLMDYCEKAAITDAVIDFSKDISDMTGFKKLMEELSKNDQIRMLKNMKESADKELAYYKAITDYATSSKKLIESTDKYYKKVIEARTETGKLETALEALRKNIEAVERLNEQIDQISKQLEELSKEGDEENDNSKEIADLTKKLRELTEERQELVDAQPDLRKEIYDKAVSTKGKLKETETLLVSIGTNWSKVLTGAKGIETAYNKYEKAQDEFDKEYDSGGNVTNSIELAGRTLIRTTEETIVRLVVDTMDTQVNEWKDKVASTALDSSIEFVEGLERTYGGGNGNGSESTNGLNGDLSEGGRICLKNEYKPVTLEQSLITNPLSGYTQEADDMSSVLDSLVSTIRAMFEVQGITNRSLDAYIETEYFNTVTSGNRKAAAQELLKAIEGFINSADDIKRAVLTVDPILLIKALIGIVQSIIHVINSLIAAIGEILEALKEIAEEGLSGQYAKFALSQYMTKNLPNRTNCDANGKLSGKGMTGFSYSDIEAAKTGRSPYEFGGISQMIGILMDPMGSSGEPQRTFVGAEAEYILGGSQSEQLNQIVTYVDIYLLRLVLCIPTVLKDKEVQSITSAIPYVGKAFLLLWIIAEPAIDAIILVNGGEQYLLRDSCYLTPSGGYKLTHDLLSLQSSDILRKFEEKNIMEWNEDIKKYSKEKKPTLISNSMKGLGGFEWKLGYEKYLTAFIWAGMSKKTILQRFANIVQFETDAYYRKRGSSFDIFSAYSTVNTEIKANLNPLFTIKNFNENAFTVSLNRYRSY